MVKTRQIKHKRHNKALSVTNIKITNIKLLVHFLLRAIDYCDWFLLTGMW